MRRLLIIIFLAAVVIFGLFFWKSHREIQVLVPFFAEQKKTELVSLLQKNGLEMTSVPIELGGKIEASVSGIHVIFSPDKNLELQVRALQLVLPKARMEGKVISEIDLRFGKIVIRY